MPATGVYIVACLEIFWSHAYVERRKLFIILESSASIGRRNNFLLFRSTFSAIDLKLCRGSARREIFPIHQWRLARVGTGAVSGRYLHSMKLCTIARQHAQCVLLSICF